MGDLSAKLVVVGAPLRMLAERYGLSWQPDRPESGLSLRLHDGALVIAGEASCYGHPVKADFVAGGAAHRRRFGSGRGQLVARACGFGKGIVPQVIDATAGLGRDSFVLASLGAEVLMIERVAAIHALLADALRRASEDPEVGEIVSRMALRHADSGETLADVVADWPHPPQVVHLDPMFPHQEKSALVKKEMRLFRELAGHDDDAPRLLEAALDVATHRVAVKRPRKAPPIDGPAPHHVIEGKTSRYDLYVRRSMKR